MTDEMNLIVLNPEPMLVEIPAPDQVLLQRVAGFAEDAKRLVVTDQRSLEGATHSLREVATLASAIDKNRKERTSILDAKKREYMALYQPVEILLAGARQSLTNMVTAYQREQERIRREAQAEADRKAEMERQRLARLADKAAERGDIKKATEFDMRESMVAPQIAPAPPPPSGVSSRKVWKFEVIDGQDLAIPREYLMPNEAKIRAVVNAMKGDARIPGVRIWSEDDLSVRKVRG